MLMSEKILTEEKDAFGGISPDELLILLDSSESAMFVCKSAPDMELIYANDRFYSILQYTSEEYREKFGNSLLASVLPEEKQKVRSLIARQAAFGGNLKLEYRAMRKDGAIIWLSMSAKVVIKDGQTIYYSSFIDVTNSKNAIDEGYNAKREADLMANSIPGGVIKVRMTDFMLVYANDGYFMLTGYSRAEFHAKFGEYCDGIIFEDDRDRVIQATKESIENHGLIGQECRILSKNGKIRWVYVNGRRVDSDAGGEPIYLCVLTDITARKEIEAELEDSVKRADVIANYLKAAVWTYDVASNSLKFNVSADTTYSIVNTIDGAMDFDRLIDAIHPDEADKFKSNFNKIKEKVGQSRGIYRMKSGNGVYRNIEISAISIGEKGALPEKIYGMLMLLDGNPAERMQEAADANMENRLASMANSARAKSEDHITNLMSYSDFLVKADKVIKSRSEDSHYAIVCADINEFLKFNHHYGFSISNEILKVFSKVLLENIAREGLCTRVDGDYFVAMFKYESHKELLKMMSSMVRSKEEYDENDGSVKFGTTTGIYLIQPEDVELFDMLEKADLARRSIKGLMGNHYAIYTEDLQKDKFREEEIIDQIDDAMRTRNIEIFYMPRIFQNKDNVIGCKAIPRIQLSDGQYIESVNLLRYVERGGKLNDFAFVSLASACGNMGAWKKQGNKIVPLSIEMTASELSIQNAADIIDDIVVKQNGLDPGSIIFEIQERYFAEATTVFDMTISSLHQRGYNIVISRFGSNHTAVNAMRRLPVTGIKFHGGFFNRNMDNKKEKIILSNIVKTAKELDMTVTCGGIQTEAQEKFAREIGCEVFEGEMYYGKVKHNILEKFFLSN